MPYEKVVKARSILLIDGPNANCLGLRHSDPPGLPTLRRIHYEAADQASELGIKLRCWQSNNESQIITWIQDANEEFDIIIINLAAFTFTSLAILEALQISELPFIELHYTNIFASGNSRTNYSYYSEHASAVICGLGHYGYTAAIDYAAKHMKIKEEAELIWVPEAESQGPTYSDRDQKMESWDVVDGSNKGDGEGSGLPTRIKSGGDDC